MVHAGVNAITCSVCVCVCVCAGTPYAIFKLKNALVNLCTAPKSTPFAIL